MQTVLFQLSFKIKQKLHKYYRVLIKTWRRQNFLVTWANDKRKYSLAAITKTLIVGYIYVTRIVVTNIKKNNFKNV